MRSQKAGQTLDTLAVDPPATPFPPVDAASRRDSRFVASYELLKPIGRGGMAEVYLARSLRSGQLLALKITRSDLAPSQSAQQRLLEEAALLGRIDSPYVTRLLDSGLHWDGRAYLAMEWVDGSTLAEELLARPRLPATEGITIARQVAEALAVVHEAGVVHRDIKPENVMVTRNGAQIAIKLIDFGIARSIQRVSGRTRRLTVPGTVLGTPEYMAPEQLTDSPVNARIDLYAFGVLMYQIFSGELPFETNRRAESVEELLAQRRSSVPAPFVARADMASVLARRLSAIVATCLAADPVRRPSSARAIAEALAPWERPRERDRPRGWGAWFSLRAAQALP